MDGLKSEQSRKRAMSPFYLSGEKVNAGLVGC